MFEDKPEEPKPAAQVLNEFLEKMNLVIQPILLDPVRCSDGSIIVKPAYVASYKQRKL